MASFGDFLKNIGSGLKNGFNTVVKAVSSGFPTVLESVVSGAKSGGIVGAIGGVVSGISGAISNIKADSTSAVAVSPVPSVNVISSTFRKAKDVFNKVAESTREFVDYSTDSEARAIMKDAANIPVLATGVGVSVSYDAITNFIKSGGLVRR